VTAADSSRPVLVGPTVARGRRLFDYYLFVPKQTRATMVVGAERATDPWMCVWTGAQLQNRCHSLGHSASGRPSADLSRLTLTTLPS
jgi:hypothetical protein